MSIVLSHSQRALFTHVLEFASHQLNRLVERYPDFYPMYTHDGHWKHDRPAWTRWCDGFLPGMMWILSAREPRWRDLAIRYSRPLEPRQFDLDVHDLGFIFMSSYHRWYQLTGESALNDVLIQAGRTMSQRFQVKGGYLRSFISAESLFIDIMMNVGIVFYAARETCDAELLNVALRHCLTTRRFLIRGDGSTAHEGLFNLETGEFLRQSTHQGYRGDSCWSRGQAWALYGFGTAYSYTQDPLFLATAEACADYYLTNTPHDGVPPWDFDAPREDRVLLDTSAAAIAASGLLQLSKLSTDAAKREFYDAAARRTLESLATAHLAESDPTWEGILKGGVYHIHKHLGVAESVMWGEYFFLEALERALGR